MKYLNRILITGAAGFVGFHLVEKFLEQGHNVVCVDNFLRYKKDKLIENLIKNKHVSWYESDLSNPEAVKTLPKDVTRIFHLAAYNGTRNFYTNPYSVLTNSSVPTVNILNYARSISCEHIFLSGSSESYADINSITRMYPTPENVPVGFIDQNNSRWSYGAAKLFSEFALRAFGQETGIPWTIGRLHNIYGPRMGTQHFIPEFINRAKQGILELYGGEQTRSFLFVEDCIDQIVKLSECKGAVGQIVNIGSEKEIRVIEVAKEIMEIMGISGVIIEMGAPRGSAQRRCPDMNLSRNLIGINERISLKKGLTLTVKWYQQRDFSNNSI